MTTLATNRVTRILGSVTQPRTVAQILATARVVAAPVDPLELASRIDRMTVRAKAPDARDLATRIAALQVRATQSKATAVQQDIPVSVKAIIRDDQGRVLVLKDAKSDWDDLPGGHLHAGESYQDGLQREVKEETGLDITVGQQIAAIDAALGPKAGPWTITKVIFFGATATGAVKLSHEHTEAQWLTHDQVQESNLGKFKNTVLGWTHPMPVIAAAHPLPERTAADDLAPEPIMGIPTTDDDTRRAHDKARAAAEAIYLAAMVTAAAKLKGEKDKRTRDAAIMLLLLVAGEDAYKKTYTALTRVPSPTEAAPAPQPAEEVAAKTLDTEAASFAKARAPLLKDFADRVADRLEETEQEAAEQGADEKEILKATRKVAEQESQKMADIETTATIGSVEIQRLQRAGFTTAVWNQIDRPTKRHTHALNMEMGAQPLGTLYPNGQRYPGDPNGGIEECVNCLCYLEGASRYPIK